MDFFKRIFPKSIPALAAIAIFFTICAICFAPQFEGRKLVMHDIQQFDGMSSDIRAHRAATGEDPQWTGAMFSGMPAYLINIRYPAQFIKSAATMPIHGFIPIITTINHIESIAKNISTIGSPMMLNNLSAPLFINCAG